MVYYIVSKKDAAAWENTNREYRETEGKYRSQYESGDITWEQFLAIIRPIEKEYFAKAQKVEAETIAKGIRANGTKKADLVREASGIVEDAGYVFNYNGKTKWIEKSWYVYKENGAWFFKMYGPQTKTAHRIQEA